jgi:hypothetical protein
MICPVDLAHDMSALRAARIGDHAKHGILLEGRDGAGYESLEVSRFSQHRQIDAARPTRGRLFADVMENHRRYA